MISTLSNLMFLQHAFNHYGFPSLFISKHAFPSLNQKYKLQSKVNDIVRAVNTKLFHATCCIG